MRRWKTPRKFGYSKRHANRILKKELEDDCKEIINAATESSATDSIASTSRNESCECIPKIVNDESAHESDSSNCEM